MQIKLYFRMGDQGRPLWGSDIWVNIDESEQASQIFEGHEMQEESRFIDPAVEVKFEDQKNMGQESSHQGREEREETGGGSSGYIVEG